jgi:hypothetical protein
VDIDGTMADWETEWFNFAAIWLDLLDKLPHWLEWDGVGELSNYMGLDKEVYRTVKLAFRQGGFKRWIRPYPQLPSLVNGIHELGAELWITTTRPYLRLDNMDPDTREWLRRNNVEYHGLIYGEDKYLQLGQAVGSDRVAAVLDNEASCYRRALGLEYSPILRRTKYNRNVLTHRHHGTIYQAHGFGEALAMITERVEKWRANHA